MDADDTRAVLNTSIQYIKGVGPRRAESFASRGIRTVADALLFLPRTYEDRRRVATIATLEIGQRVSFRARVEDFAVRRIGRSPRRQMFELLLGDDTGRITCRWFHFNQASFANRFRRGEWVRVAGKVSNYRGRRVLIHPDVEKVLTSADDAGEDFAAVVPVYPEIEGIYPKVVRRVMRRVVGNYSAHYPERLPAQMRQRLRLPGVDESLRLVHFPPRQADLAAYQQWRTPQQRRLVFEEFLLLQLGLALRRRRWKSNPAEVRAAPGELHRLAREMFGFELTGAQKRVLAEIAGDMAAAQPMNRLLQGDVGSGKTAVALLAALLARQAGAQTALMAPTEILAEQHFAKLGRVASRRLAGQPGLRLELLTSSVKGARREQVLAAVAAGQVDLLVGTHALLQQRVQFARLGLCIIDEQHRFGVMQRARLRQKGKQPHVLVMTATPIPRTMAMTLYGDLDVSVLDELPPGRVPIRTVVLRGNQASQAYRQVRREVEDGGQAYVVYPLVQESEKIDLRDASSMFERLRQGAFSGLSLGLLHGRMDADEKEQVMKRFARGQLQILVATTVIEVGIDVPRATVMVVEHAERFGLSQLHQLRGRVGRGRRPGSCFLVAHNLASEDARRRLQVMARTSDGFEIAEADLAIRGPGEFLGTRQSGLPVFAFGDLVRDADLLQLARDEARTLVEADPELKRPQHAALLEGLRQRWAGALALAEVG
ncbi:MAG: DNA helicase RecG [Deltaproteobacteria bacterium]|nr:MAG: DNA helicase RecG [Deltaproteobacteria bacterium]